MQHLGQMYTKRLFAVYLKFKFNEVSHVFTFKYGNPNLYPRMAISAVLPPLAPLYQQKSREPGGSTSPGLLLITVETKAKSRLGGIIPLSLSPHGEFLMNEILLIILYIYTSLELNSEE